MGNELFNRTVKELDFLGDILSVGIVERGLEKVGSTPDTVTPQKMRQAIDIHVSRALAVFIPPERVTEVTNTLIKRVKEFKTSKAK